eukprot:767626-Hanusia_phi.AAC.3
MVGSGRGEERRGEERGGEERRGEERGGEERRGEERRGTSRMEVAGTGGSQQVLHALRSQNPSLAHLHYVWCSLAVV